MGQRSSRGPHARVAAPAPPSRSISPPPRETAPPQGTRILLAAAVAIGAALRVGLPFRNVFMQGFVNFQTSDSWYHTRLIDNLARNFPHSLHTDPYAAAGGMAVPVGPLFDFSVAGAARLLAFGMPSQRMLEIVAAFSPVVYALLTVIVVFAIGRRLFDPLTGLLAAALLATTPGPFLDRTIVGYVDHHAAEALLSAVTLLFLARAFARIRGGSGRQAVAAESAVAGVALGGYLMTWTSGSFLVFIIAAWAGFQYAVDHLRGAPSDRVARVLLPALLVAALVVVLFEDARVPQHDVRLLALAGAFAGVVTLEVLRRGWQRLKLPPALFVAAGAGVAVLALVAVSIAAPRTFGDVLNNVRRLIPDAAAQTVGEARPLFAVDTVTSALRAWAEFRSTFFLAMPALVLLGVDIWRKRVEERGLLFIWTVVAMLATIGQNRFGYYLSIELALLAGWLSARLLRWAGATNETARARYLTDGVVVLVSAVVFYPNIPPALRSARLDFGMPVQWHAALDWMRSSTPDPFGDREQYYALEAAKQPAYTVMNWWDYGYWVMRVGRRVPVANPTQKGAYESARFFTETDEGEAEKLLSAAHARYVITGEELPPRNVPSATPWQRWFEAMPLWGNRDFQQYYQAFYEKNAAGRLVPTRVFSPQYYRSMMSRLYFYGARAANPANATWVMTFEVRRQARGGQYREITSSRLFENYEAGLQYFQSLGQGNHMVAGRDPGRTCIPLPAMAHLRLAYDSPNPSSAFPETPSVRIFEVVE